jgi:hypothetical protein
VLQYQNEKGQAKRLTLGHFRTAHLDGPRHAKASNWMEKTWRAVANLTGVPDLDMRHFRSGYINTLGDMGMHVEEVASITQHLSLATIRNHYALQNESRAAVDARRGARRLVSFNESEAAVAEQRDHERRDREEWLMRRARNLDFNSLGLMRYSL